MQKADVYRRLIIAGGERAVIAEAKAPSLLGPAAAS
jgi:hypothetical protein